MTCFLCLQKKQQTFRIFHNKQELKANFNIPQLVEKYTSIKPSELDSLLCVDCWKTIEAFHLFCLDIQNAHKSFEGHSEDIANIKIEEYEEYEQPIEIAFSDDGFKDNGKIQAHSPINSDENTYAEDEYVEASFLKKDVFKKNSNNIIKKNKSKIKQTRTKVKKLNSRKLENNKVKNDEIIESDSELNSNTINQIEKKSKQSNGKIIDSTDELIASYMILSCNICKESAKTLSELKLHFRQAHQQKGYAMCCNKKFYKRYLLSDHINCHFNPNYFKCEICKKTYAIAECLKKHMKDVHENERIEFSCDQCPKKFLRKSILERHKAFHLPQDSWQFSCDSCTKNFPSKYYLTSHKNFVHKEISTKIICYVCGQSVASNRFKRHIQGHDSTFEEEKVECSICKAKLKKRYINIHILFSILT